MTVEEMNNEMVPILEAWRNLQNQIAGLLAGKPVRCFDETMLAMDNAVRRLNAGEPPLLRISDEIAMPQASGSIWLKGQRDAGEPGPRCPKCGAGAPDLLLKESSVHICYVECHACEADWEIDSFAELAQFFPAERQEGWDIMRDALKSIAANTCCDTCREAALVAQKALKDALPATPSAPEGKEKA